MALKKILENVSLAATSNGAAVTFNVTPFLANKPCNFLWLTAGITGTPTVKIQGSNDSGSTWTDLDTFSPTAANFSKLAAGLFPYKQVRGIVSVAGTAGNASLYADCDP